MKFEHLKEYVKTHKRLDLKHFNNAQEVCNMIDLLNEEREKEMEKKGSRMAGDISKWYVNNMNRTTPLHY